MAAPTSYLVIEEVHLCMLNILDDILAFLNEHDIPYVLSGGSALGAIRHRGFIPWDDDIDLAIPREGYNEFLKNYKPTNKDYSVISVYDSDNSDISYMRVVDVKTASSNRYLNINNGIFVDVFPIDHLPDSNFGQYMAYYRMKYLDFLRNSTRRIEYKKADGMVRNTMKRAFSFGLRNKKIGHYANKMNKLALKTNEKNKDSHTVSLYVVQGINKLRESNTVETYTTERQKAMFEGREVYVPGENYLVKIYGPDYMEIPRKHKTHGKFYIINEKDTGLSWRDALEQLNDQDEIVEANNEEDNQE